MKWSEQAWKLAEPTYKRILEQNFIQQLMAGTLAREKFLFYLGQDALYIGAFGKALAGIASRLDSKDQVEAFLGFAGDTVAVEQALHQSFLKENVVVAELEPSPTCLLYTSYMLSQLAKAPVEVAMASVLPCFWVYKEVGDHILAHQSKDDNPYQDWIDTYGGEEYGNAVHKAIALCDEAAAATTETRRAEMTKAYVLCTKMEWMFWESAWNLESWPV